MTKHFNSTSEFYGERMNNNPEGINQYTGGSGVSKMPDKALGQSGKLYKQIEKAEKAAGKIQNLSDFNKVKADIAIMKKAADEQAKKEIALAKDKSSTKYKAATVGGSLNKFGKSK